MTFICDSMNNAHLKKEFYNAFFQEPWFNTNAFNHWTDTIDLFYTYCCL